MQISIEKKKKKTIIEIFPYVSCSIFIASYLLSRAINRREIEDEWKNITLKIFFDLSISVRKWTFLKLKTIRYLESISHA